MTTSTRKAGIVGAALLGWLCLLDSGCAVRVRPSDAEDPAGRRPSPPAEHTVPARTPAAEPPMHTATESPKSAANQPPKEVVPARVPLNEAGCPADLPNAWSPCSALGQTCSYPCASKPGTELEVVCSYVDKQWVPTYQMDGIECP